MNNSIITNLNIENGEGSGSVQQKGYTDANGSAMLGAIASGEGAVAFGGQRYDKAGKPVEEAPITEASGKQSFAFGGGNLAVGDWSFAGNKDTKALQRSDFAIGGGTRAGRTYEEWLEFNGLTASGVNLALYKKEHHFAFAQGDLSIAKGFGSAALNKSNANGRYSFSSGVFSTADGDGAFAAGYDTNSNGSYSATFGAYTVAQGNYSLVAGVSSKATSEVSFAFGKENEANNIFSAAFGYHSIANGSCSFVAGGLVTVEGDYAAAFGKSTVAEGTYSFVAGYNSAVTGEGSASFGANHTVLGDFCAAIGFQNGTEGEFSYAFGNQLKAARNQLVIGKYNDRNIFNASALFIIGNGVSDSSRSNAFEVYKNGRAKVYGAPTESNDVLRWQEYQKLVTAIEALGGSVA